MKNTNIKNQSQILDLKWQNLAVSIGEFMNYWGFRGIQGQIWTLIYLSQNPMSGVEITQKLKVSKALVSPALKELEEFGLIYCVSDSSQKTKYYQAEPDVFYVIQKVLKQREAPLIQKSEENFQKFKSEVIKNEENQALINLKHLQQLETMIVAAQTTIEFALQMKSLSDAGDKLS